MRQYELTVLLHPDLEIDLTQPLQKVRDIVTAGGAVIASEDNWGKKRLAYRIRRQDFAVYIFFELEAPAGAVQKIDGTLGITDEVLRHLLVLKDLKRPDDEDEDGQPSDEPKKEG